MDIFANFTMSSCLHFLSVYVLFWYKTLFLQAIDTIFSKSCHPSWSFSFLIAWIIHYDKMGSPGLDNKRVDRDIAARVILECLRYSCHRQLRVHACGILYSFTNIISKYYYSCLIGDGSSIMRSLIFWLSKWNILQYLKSLFFIKRNWWAVFCLSLYARVIKKNWWLPKSTGSVWCWEESAWCSSDDGKWVTSYSSYWSLVIYICVTGRCRLPSTLADFITCSLIRDICKDLFRERLHILHQYPLYIARDM